MENGHSFFHYGQPEKSSSDSIPMQNHAEAVREENRSVPIACVQRLIRKVLPRYAKVTDESKVKIVECVTEFICFITGVANHRCQVEQRKTVTAEDLIYAMAKLGFDNYAELLTLFLHRYRQHHVREGANRVPHRAGSPANDAVSVFPPPVVPPFPDPMGGFYSDGSSVGASTTNTTANLYYEYDHHVAYSFGNSFDEMYVAGQQ